MKWKEEELYNQLKLSLLISEFILLLDRVRKKVPVTPGWNFKYESAISSFILKIILCFSSLRDKFPSGAWAHNSLWWWTKSECRFICLYAFIYVIPHKSCCKMNTHILPQSAEISMLTLFLCSYAAIHLMQPRGYARLWGMMWLPPCINDMGGPVCWWNHVITVITTLSNMKQKSQSIYLSSYIRSCIWRKWN